MTPEPRGYFHRGGHHTKVVRLNWNKSEQKHLPVVMACYDDCEACRVEWGPYA